MGDHKGRPYKGLVEGVGGSRTAPTGRKERGVREEWAATATRFFDSVALRSECHVGRKDEFRPQSSQGQALDAGKTEEDVE